MAGNTGSPGKTVTSRVLALLGAFDQEHRAMSLSMLAERSGLTLTTTHRLASELVAGGVLYRHPSGAFSVGRRLWDLGLLAPVELDLRRVAVPFLSDVHAATRATVHLAVRDGDEVLYLERISGRTSVPVVSTIGSTLPLHCTGVGKVLLAHAPSELQRRVLDSLQRMTVHTIVQPGVLRAQLGRIREEGLATTQEEMTLGACSVAVPIRRGEDVVAALGVVVTSLRRDRARLATALQVAAQSIGRTLR